MSEHGIFEMVAGRPAVRFERRLAHPVEAVWAAVTEPAELVHWFPTPVEIDELRPGGAMTFAFPRDATHGEVLEVEPPRRFVFRWDADVIRIEVEPDGDGSVLRFTHVLSERDEGARAAAGWHVCLDTLERRLQGEDTPTPGGPTPEWRAHYAKYLDLGLPSGAPVPD